MNFWANIGFPVLTVSIGLLFYQVQNQNRLIGGAISFAKAIWLSQCIIVWMVYPLILIIGDIGSTNFKIILIFHLMSWYLRAPLEVAMLYIWHNWNPIYGIIHDSFHLLLLTVLFVFLPFSHYLEWTFFLLLALGTIFETFFASYFLRLRGQEKTKIYFASNSPEWRKNNFITWVANIITISLFTYTCLNIQTL